MGLSMVVCMGLSMVVCVRLSKMVCMGLSKVVFGVYGVKQSHWGCFRILHWAHFEV